MMKYDKEHNISNANKAIKDLVTGDRDDAVFENDRLTIINVKLQRQISRFNNYFPKYYLIVPKILNLLKNTNCVL